MGSPKMNGAEFINWLTDGEYELTPPRDTIEKENLQVEEGHDEVSFMPPRRSTSRWLRAKNAFLRWTRGLYNEYITKRRESTREEIQGAQQIEDDKQNTLRSHAPLTQTKMETKCQKECCQE